MTSSPGNCPIPSYSVAFTSTTSDDFALPGHATCGCYVGPWLGITSPPRCPMHEASAMPAPWLPVRPLDAFPLPKPHRLHPDDIDAIARRVVEMLKDKP